MQGYPGVDDDGGLTFEETIEGVPQLLDELFPSDVTIIAEPGRYFCTACYTLAVTIISRRDRYVCNNRYAVSTLSSFIATHAHDILRMTFNLNPAR